MGGWTDWGAKTARRMTGGLALAAALAAPAAASAAKPRAREPLKVQTASLSQGGRKLYWRLRLTRPLSLSKLQHERRSLCLLIEAPPHGHVTGQLCARPPTGHHTGPTVVYSKIQNGQAQARQFVPANVTRPHRNELDAVFLPSDVGLGYRKLYWQVRNTVNEPRCTRHNPRKPGCVRLYPHHPRGLRLHVPQLVRCEPGGQSLVFHGPSSRHEVAFTFDDGPWGDPPTSQFLDVLERNHVPATFFEIGEQISPYDPGGTLERRMLADGDLIGDHTWSHPDMTGLSSSEQRSQLEQTASAITQATHGFHTCLWRPPYGAENSEVVSLARSLGLITIQWDVDPQDWSTPGTDTIYQRVVSGAHNGAIILQHNGGGPRQETLDALPREIATLRGQGYHFVTLAQMLGLRLIYK
ncbi:MAG: polysaccharide deacetylase family protein [Solirubrobacteraceae bacterium]